MYKLHKILQAIYHQIVHHSPAQFELVASFRKYIYSIIHDLFIFKKKHKQFVFIC